MKAAGYDSELDEELHDACSSLLREANDTGAIKKCKTKDCRGRLMSSVMPMMSWSISFHYLTRNNGITVDYVPMSSRSIPALKSLEKTAMPLWFYSLERFWKVHATRTRLSTTWKPLRKTSKHSS